MAGNIIYGMVLVVQHNTSLVYFPHFRLFKNSQINLKHWQKESGKYGHKSKNFQK